ncbi:hypothetical protein ACF0H5_004336 [Mactra antiquata]
MKLAVYFVAILVCVQLSPTSAWGRRSRKSRKSKTSVDVKVSANKGGAKVSGAVKHQRDNWSAGVKGTVDSDGNWGVVGELSAKFKKRSVDWHNKHYIVTLSVDQCNFNVYDVDRDGYITMEEIKNIFGEGKGPENLFNDLNMTTDDNVVDEKEFIAMAPLLIRGCESTDLQNNSL